MSIDEEFINNFYDNTTQEISEDDYTKIQRLLMKYKKQTIEDDYLLFVADRDIIVKLFILFLFYYDFDITINNIKPSHVAIDFEFNRGKIALMQMNFTATEKHLWIIDPKSYNRDKINIIKQKLLLNNKIYKVLHGADSLDLPYMFADIFYTNQKEILQFMKKFIDTRYLCEYVRGSKEEIGKCSIYDAMLYFNTITKQKYDGLQKINSDMGPIHKIMWDVKKLNGANMQYAFYDVIYLLDFLKDIYKKILNDTPRLVRSYYYINEIIRFVILERKNVTDVLHESKIIVTRMNNYLVKSSTNNKTMLELYNQIMQQFVIQTNEEYIDIGFIQKVNYIKNVFDLLLKHIVYSVCSHRSNINIYINKNDKMTEQITLNNLYHKLETVQMYKIIKLLKLYENQIIKIL